MTLGNKYIYANGECWMVKNADYSQKVRRFNWNKFGGNELALQEAQAWRDAEEQKLKDNAEGAIVEYNKVLEENKKFKEQQEAEYKKLKAKEDLEWEKEVRMQQAKARLIKNKKLKEMQEDMDYFNECLTMKIEQVRAKWDSGVWNHLDPKGNRFVTDPDALKNWIKGYPAEAETPEGKQLIKKYTQNNPDYKCVTMINILYNKMTNKVV